MSIGRVKEFDVAKGNWKAYCERVDMFFTANGIKETLKLPAFLAMVGDETYELMSNLTSPQAPSSLSYDQLKEVMANHLQPKPSIMAERYRFRQRRQRADENLANYIADLKRLARYCEFNSTLEDNLRDQFVCGVASDNMRQRLFAESKLTFTGAVTLAISIEAAEKDSASVDKTAATGEAEDTHYQRTQKQCAVCGSYNHVAAGCNYRDYECDHCGLKGHLKKMCRSRIQDPNGSPPWKAQGATSSRGRGARGYAGSRQRRRIRGRDRSNATTQHLMQETEEISGSKTNDIDPTSSEEEPVYQMSLKKYPAVSIPVLVNNLTLPMEVDTGSSLSCISEHNYLHLFANFPLKQCRLTLKFYDGSKTTPLGYIEVPVKYNKTNKVLDLYVIKGGTTTLLGRQWLTELGIQVPEFQCNNVNNCKDSLSESKNDIVSLIDRYAELFDGALGRYRGGQATLHVRPDAIPVYCRPRPLPYSLKERVDAEIDAMLKNGTIEPVDTSEWATPLVIVPKPNGKIRVCADYKVTLNPALLVDRYPLPRVEDLFAQLNGGEQFSKIDMSAAYNQIELDKTSQYTVINTHRGLFKYNRLVFGLSSSPGIFSRIITNLVREIPGVVVFMDDILVTAKNKQLHIKTLNTVLSTLQKNGFRLNKDKCVFLADSVSYLGYVIDKNGIRTDPEKIKAIKDLPNPTNVTELRSFLGVVNFYARFIKNLSTHLAPLYELLKKSKEWNWNESCRKSFKFVKGLLMSTEVLAHYNRDEQLILTCDASARGIGAVLSQPALMPGSRSRCERPVAYASRSLTKAEQQYSQIQKEALAIIYSVKKFHQYLYGRRFLLRTDHKPLVSIFGPKTGIPTMAASRLQRWAIILSGYEYEIEYVRSSDNGADGLSRLPVVEEAEKVQTPEQTYLHFARDAFLLDYDELRRETAKDSILGRVVTYVNNEWPTNVEVEQLRPYFNRRNELYIELGCLMWGHRLVIPIKCRERVLKELHETHLGMVKMKSLARSYVWWPGIDEAIEATCRACAVCAAHASAPPHHESRPWAPSEKPWQRLHIDFLGPINNLKFFIIIDSTSKWIEYFKMKNTNAVEVIARLRRLFSQFGLPKQVVSDNGPPFTSEAFKLFLSNNGIEHCTTAPYHPSSNGAAESAVKICKSVIKKALSEGVDLETALDRYLLLYRNTEHGSTGETPARILQGRALRLRLDALKPDRMDKVRKALTQQVSKNQGVCREFKIGDPIYLQTYKDGVPTGWKAGEVVSRLGQTNYEVKDTTGLKNHRHIDQLKSRVRTSLVFPTTSLAFPTTSRSDGLFGREVDSETLDDTVNTALDHSVDRGRERQTDGSLSTTSSSPLRSCGNLPVTVKRIRKPPVRFGVDEYVNG